MFGLQLLMAFVVPCIEVAGDRILARDLAHVVPAFERVDPSAVVGYAPNPGLVRWLLRSELSAVLGAGMPEADLPHRICVVRKARVPGNDELLEAMRKVLPADAEVTLVRAPSLPIPAGAIEFHTSGIRSSGLPGIYTWKGRIVPSGNGRSVPVTVVVRIRLERVVLVAGRTVAAGSLITAGDLQKEVREVGWPPPQPIEEGQTFEGWKARRRLEAGTILDPDWLAPPLAVKRGEKVTLVAEQQGAVLRTETTALTGGRAGDLIFVRSPFSSRRIRARLVRMGEALVLGGERLR